MAGEARAPQRLGSYILIQGTIAAVLNAIINPALAWLLNRKMEFVPLGDVAVDTAITCVVLSLLVALCVTAGVRREVIAGRLESTGEMAGREGWLHHLPAKSWALGLVIGACAAAVLVLLVLAVFRLAGLPGLSFPGFAVLKIAYTGLMGYAVTRWVILRQVLALTP